VTVRPKAGLGIGSTGGQSTLERSQLLPEDPVIPSLPEVLVT
jgi:hypothetical protein